MSHIEYQQRLALRLGILRARLLRHYAALFPGHTSLIESVLDDAESTARRTPFPHLFLPDLAEARMARIATSA